MSNSTHREIIEAYVASIPQGKRFTSSSVSEETGVYPEAVSHHFTGLWRDGLINRVGSERVHKRKRYVYVRATSSKTESSDRQQLLNLLPIFTTNELIEELKRRAA